MRVVVGITGASGAIFAIRSLEVLQSVGVETHLVMSAWGARTLEHETDYTAAQVRGLATASYSINDQAALISSGSFISDGMIVVPCSVKTLSTIACGYGSDLISRAADVMLKERRRLVLVVRETPLNSIHLRNMLLLSDMGVTIFPPVPSLYNHPVTIDDLVDYTVARALDQFGVVSPGARRWSGSLERSQASSSRKTDPDQER